MNRPALTVALAALLLTGACDLPSDSTVGPTASGSTTAKPANAPAAGTFGGDAGTLTVGKDIKAGTYRSTTPADSLGCYWSRLKGTGGQVEDIIANGLARPGARVVVTIGKTDKAFETTGCGTWAAVRS